MIKGVKICGVSDIRTLKYIIDHKFPPKFVGFISNYPKSKRYVDFETLKKLTSYEKKKTNYVSVLVNLDNIILEKIKDLKIDYYQLYNVDPERTKLIKKKYNKKIITALTIESKSDINEYIKYQNIADIILFDGKGYEKSIGFNHSLLNHVTNNIIKMVAGNININNIPMLPNLDYIIDISGSLENSEGNKDLNKIDFFLKNINKNEN